MDAKLLTFQLDGVRIDAQPEQTILEAAEAAGYYIPRLCHLDGLQSLGGCRMCVVNIDGHPGAACVQPVRDGAVVESDTEALNAQRRALLELVFVEGRHFCMSCERSGACELQALAYRLGLRAPQFKHLPRTRDLDASHPHVMLDHGRCILCARCVRTSRDVDGKAVFGFVGRGPDRHVAINGGARLVDSQLNVADAALSVCPVGALLKKRVGFVVPVGSRPYDHVPIGAAIEEDTR